MNYSASRLVLSVFLLLCFWTVTSAQPLSRTSDSASFIVNFRQSKWNLDSTFGNNAAVLDSIDHLFTTIHNDSVYRLRHVSFTGCASPEGSPSFNRFLSEQRAKALFDHMSRYGFLRDEEKRFTFLGRDWGGVLRLAEADKALPYRDETIAYLRAIVGEERQTDKTHSPSLERLKSLHSGKPYTYLYNKVFPFVRVSILEVKFDRIFSPAIAVVRPDEITFAHIDSIQSSPPSGHIAIIPDTVVNRPGRPFYMDVRSNMLFDALALPNVGIELYVGSNISLGVNCVYAWWSNNARHRYWRAYGAELFARRWFGGAAQRKPLTGHHLGVYGQIYTYDFEWGAKGEMGGYPGGNIWDKAQWGAGVEYGYSLPVSRRINIDFTLGIGYTTGYYYTYKPADTHYLWQSTKRRKWFGPTKAEISLVWLIGSDNYNRPKAAKGGER